jgi:hypothetical protein
MLALILRRDVTNVGALSAVGFTAGRFLFALRVLMPSAVQFPMGFTGMNLTYIGTFMMGLRVMNVI